MSLQRQICQKNDQPGSLPSCTIFSTDALDSLGEANRRILLGLPLFPIEPTLGTRRCFGSSFLLPVKLLLLGFPPAIEPFSSRPSTSASSASDVDKDAPGEVAAD
jgi:hypothetical protein